jgi:hypothetical protein
LVTQGYAQGQKPTIDPVLHGDALHPGSLRDLLIRHAGADRQLDSFALFGGQPGERGIQRGFGIVLGTGAISVGHWSHTPWIPWNRFRQH